MKYIDLLTKEEKSILCGIITGRDFKELFKRNEQEFSKIRKGFRAKSLTEQQALTIAIVNVDKPFIAMWVNTKVDIWLKEIQENIEGLEREGSTHDIALAMTPSLPVMLIYTSNLQEKLWIRMPAQSFKKEWKASNLSVQRMLKWLTVLRLWKKKNAICSIKLKRLSRALIL